MIEKEKAAIRSRWLIVLMLAIMVIFGVWASFSEIDQIARAPGQVIASARTQVVQAAVDGVIEDLLVREGQRVSKGEVLVRLDRSQAAAARQDSLAKVAALKAMLIRLQAEVFSRPLAFPAEVASYPEFVTNQGELFRRRQQALHAEIAALTESLRLVQKELALSESLVSTGDIGQAEVIRMQKQVADLRGQITNRRNKYFQDAQEQMTKAEEDLATQEQALAERTTLWERTEIFAPADGLVKSIQLTTPGAKVRPGDVILEILPTGSDLIVEARLKPADIAYVRQGLPAAVKLDAFDYSIYGVLQGSVSYISPDALTEKTGQGEQVYYRVQVRIDQAALAERNRQYPDKTIEIQPGMTATIDITTGRRTVLAYLTKPITKVMTESMGER